ncbi:hypothetical protein FOBRF1_002306 [Fusarium oxysporum]
MQPAAVPTIALLRCREMQIALRCATGRSAMLLPFLLLRVIFGYKDIKIRLPQLSFQFGVEQHLPLASPANSAQFSST